VNRKLKVPGTVVLIVGGFQIPVIPLIEVVARVGGTVFSQRVPIGANVGVVGVVTVISRVVVLAHSNASGEKVYVPEAVLLTVGGFQVPFIPFVEVAGSKGATAPEQMVVTMVKAGTMVEATVTVIVNGAPVQELAVDVGVTINSTVPAVAPELVRI
jgi:hypothetical protein